MVLLMITQNTSGLIQEIGWQVGASMANLGTNGSSTNSSYGLDAPYFDVSARAPR